MAVTFIFSIPIPTNIKISLPIFISDNKFLCLIMFHFFWSNRHFHLVYGLTFTNSTNNTAIISTFKIVKIAISLRFTDVINEILYLLHTYEWNLNRLSKKIVIVTNMTPF